MPHPGHLIISSMCEFVLNTYVGGYIVSTVGEYWPSKSSREIHASIYDKEWFKQNQHLKGDVFNSAYKKRFGFMQLGAGEDSIYETMIFKAKRSEYGCCPWEQVSGEGIDSERYAKPEEARKGHMNYCKKWSE